MSNSLSMSVRQDFLFSAQPSKFFHVPVVDEAPLNLICGTFKFKLVEGGGGRRKGEGGRKGNDS